MRYLALCATALLAASAGANQQTVPINGDRLSGFVLPTEPLEATMRISALRASAWKVDDTQRLALEHDVRIEIGGRQYRSTGAVVWLNRIPSADGLINQIAAYFEDLENPSEHGSGTGVSGREILITASTRGTVTLDVALLTRELPVGDAAARVARADRRLADYLRRLNAQPPPLVTGPRRESFAPLPPPPPQPGDPVRSSVPAPPGEMTRPVRGAQPIPLFEPQGTFHVSFEQATFTGGEDEDVLLLIGPLVVEYVAEGIEDRWHHLTLSAQRAVVFAEPGSAEAILGGTSDAERFRGIYLEGNVTATADAGKYTVRAPRVYYDVRTNQAIMLDAVLRTYTGRNRIPIYARAEEMRQLATDRWTGKGGRISTSEFFVPHVAIGAERVTVTERPVRGDSTETDVWIESENNTVRASGVPFVWWPKFTGRAEDVPLRGVAVGTSRNIGIGIQTRWDPFGLLGVERPQGWEGNVRIDGYTDRGPALGLDMAYDRGPSIGAIDLYGMHDDGVDRTSSGRDVTPSDEWRGLALWEHSQKLSESWDFQGQFSWISDETFVTSWRAQDFYNRREYETAGVLQSQEENTAFTALFKYNLNDFISNSYLLASRAYQVQKLPELAYGRYGDSWFSDRFTYSGDTRLGRMQFEPQSGTPADLGVSGRAFGIGPNDSIAASLALPTQWVTRFDTRHEIAFPVAWGPIKAVPFVVGRLTAYSDDITVSAAGDKTRFFGSAGLRVNTQMQRVDNRVESRLFDLHRVRHVLEPRLSLWYGYAGIPDGDLPVYDESVESIGGASVFEAGLLSTWQTERGGPGRWHSVDFLTIDASVVLNSNDANPESPTPQFFEYRPEYSQFGDHVAAAATWLLSDHLSVVGEATYDLDTSRVARGSIGTQLHHTPLLSTFVEYRFIDADDTRLLDIGWAYRLTPKYRVALQPQWDFTFNEFRAVRLQVVRRFPEFDLTFAVRRDEIADDTSIGASIGLVEF